MSDAVRRIHVLARQRLAIAVEQARAHALEAFGRRRPRAEAPVAQCVAIGIRRNFELPAAADPAAAGHDLEADVAARQRDGAACHAHRKWLRQ
jgi:hypothetical protein